MIPGVPDGPRKLAFRAFVREVQSLPLLANSRVIKTWRAWEGKPSEASPPTGDQMPCVQFRLMSGPVRRLASTRRPGGAATFAIETKPTITIELWTKGTDQGDSANVADLIHRTLASQDNCARKATQARLGAVGIRDWHLVGEILPPGPDAFSETAIYAVGSYQLTLILSS